MKRFILIITLCIVNISLSAQSRFYSQSRPMNNLSVSLLGDAFIALNYERLVLINENSFLTGKLGIGYSQDLISFGKPDRYVTFPHHISYNLGVKNSFIEIGVGGKFINYGSSLEYGLYPLIGLRFQPLKFRKANCRFYFHPTYKREDFGLAPIGISCGISF